MKTDCKHCFATRTSSHNPHGALPTPSLRRIWLCDLRNGIVIQEMKCVGRKSARCPLVIAKKVKL